MRDYDGIKLPDGLRVIVCSWLMVGVLVFSSRAGADEAESPGVKMAHLFIRADANEVMIENIWVFERAKAGQPWTVEIQLPPQATGIRLDEPGSTSYDELTGKVKKTIAADSLIDSAGFSYLLDNVEGECSFEVESAYPVELMVASVSGPATRLMSDSLKFDEERQSRSRFSGVYTAENLPANLSVRLGLSNLPQPDSGLFETVCLAVVGVILVLAGITGLILRRLKNTPGRS